MIPAMWSIPILFFVLLEGGLRVFGFGDEYPLFIPAPGFPEYLLPNPDVGERYFGRTRAVPGPAHDAFLAEKPEGTIRIFVQGGSTAAGFPYGHGATIARALRQRTSQQLPEQAIEFVNTAMDAVSSTVLADFTDEIIEQKPDAVLVYAGHNEFYGALGVASTESLGSSDAIVRLYLAIDEIRIVQLIRRAWNGMMGPVAVSGSSASVTLMEELAKDRYVPSGSGLRARGIERFRSNLSRMLCSYRDAGVRAFVGTVFSNERGMPPLASRLAEGTDSTAWAAARVAVSEAVAEGDVERALQASKAVLDIDSTAALVHFGYARLLERAGRSEEALAEYRAAIDHDALPFRAPMAINRTIHEVAAECGAELVGTRDALASAVPGGIIGNELILEHLHPNLDGYFLLSETFYRALEQTGVLDRPASRIPLAAARAEMLVTELDSTIASIHVRRLLNSWPFSRTAGEDTFVVATPIDLLATEVLQGTRTWESAMIRLGGLYDQQGDMVRALMVALSLVQEYPYRGAPLVLAGNVLVRQNRLQDALRFFLAANAREATTESLRMTGQLLTRLGRAQDALQPLERALATSGENPAVLYDLGVTYITLGRKDEALRTAQRILAMDPSHPGALRLYESALGDAAN